MIVCMHACACLRVRVRVHAYVCTNMRVRVLAYGCMHARVHAHVCVRISVFLRRHTMSIDMRSWVFDF